MTIDPVTIRLRDIHRFYTVGTETIRALNGVDLEIRRNEYVAIMGASGSGKSTLMNLLGCLDRATSGVYELDGQNATSLSNASLAQIRNEKIGFVFQSFELLPRLSALKNVELPLLYSRQAVWSRRETARKALDRVAPRPNGCTTAPTSSPAAKSSASPSPGP